MELLRVLSGLCVGPFSAPLPPLLARTPARKPRTQVPRDPELTSRCGGLASAGASEDKPEVAARVAWSGAGPNLKTGKPKPQAVRVAVRAVLDDPRYRARARTLATEYRSYDPIARVIQIVETITSAASADARGRSGSETHSVERLVLDAGTLSKLV